MPLGNDRVRMSFNPDGNSLVNKIKGATADLIDVCNAQNDTHDDPEEGRLWSLAMTHYEIAAMWAVKAATTEK
jgi:hypothetical protein